MIVQGGFDIQYRHVSTIPVRNRQHILPKSDFVSFTKSLFYLLAIAEAMFCIFTTSTTY
jgi:hypothetical protein